MVELVGWISIWTRRSRCSQFYKEVSWWKEDDQSSSDCAEQPAQLLEIAVGTCAVETRRCLQKACGIIVLSLTEILDRPAVSTSINNFLENIAELYFDLFKNFEHVAWIAVRIADTI